MSECRKDPYAVRKEFRRSSKFITNLIVEDIENKSDKILQAIEGHDKKSTISIVNRIIFDAISYDPIEEVFRNNVFQIQKWLNDFIFENYDDMTNVYKCLTDIRRMLPPTKAS